MKTLAIAAVAACLTLFAGCASVESFLNHNSLAAQLVVQEATARVIESGHTVPEKQQRATKIAEITNAVKVTFDTTAMDLPGIVALVTQRIVALKLGPADAILAQGLLEALAQEIALKACPAQPAAAAQTACTVPANFKVYVDQVLSWVLQTAALYTLKS